MDNNFYNNNMQQTPQQGSCPKFTGYLIWAIVETLCCCQLFGIIGIVLAILMNSAFHRGDAVDYENKARATKAILIAGVIIGGIISIVLCAVYIISFIAS